MAEYTELEKKDYENYCALCGWGEDSSMTFYPAVRDTYFYRTYVTRERVKELYLMIAGRVTAFIMGRK